jgi:lipoate-protein ligase A
MTLKAWKLCDSGKKSASCHMQMDELLLKNLQQSQEPILHFYEWEQDSATYGYFIKPENFLKLDKVKEKNLELAKRPTGGGIVFHLRDLAFSVLLPSSHPGFSLNTLNNYAYINEILKEAIMKFRGERADHLSLLPKEFEELVPEASFFCMAKPTKYDVILNGLKVGGGAERLTKYGLLHQGTIALGLPTDEYLSDLLISKDVLNCMKKNSCLLLQKNHTEETFKTAKKEIQQLLKDAFFTR